MLEQLFPTTIQNLILVFAAHSEISIVFDDHSALTYYPESQHFEQKAFYLPPGFRAEALLSSGEAIVAINERNEMCVRRFGSPLWSASPALLPFPSTLNKLDISPCVKIHLLMALPRMLTNSEPRSKWNRQTPSFFGETKHGVRVWVLEQEKFKLVTAAGSANPPLSSSSSSSPWPLPSLPETARGKRKVLFRFEETLYCFGESSKYYALTKAAISLGIWEQRPLPDWLSLEGVTHVTADYENRLLYVLCRTIWGFLALYSFAPDLAPDRLCWKICIEFQHLGGRTQDMETEVLGLLIWSESDKLNESNYSNKSHTSTPRKRSQASRKRKAPKSKSRRR